MALLLPVAPSRLTLTIPEPSGPSAATEFVTLARYG